MKYTTNVKIQFCYPDPNSSADMKMLVKNITKTVKEGSEIGFAGFQKKADFKSYLAKRIFGDSAKIQNNLLLTEKDKIEVLIQSTTQKCFEKIGTKTIYIFVFPWLEEYDKEFGVVNGFSPYANTVHLFISPEKHSSQSLVETVAHELNHAIFLSNRNSNLELTLLETLIFEGLAENFREEVVGGEISPWSNALNERECKETSLSLKQLLGSRDENLYEKVFFGGEKYKKWTGYSVGYRIVKSFRSTYPDKSWEQIMKMKAEEIFEMSLFTKNNE